MCSGAGEAPHIATRSCRGSTRVTESLAQIVAHWVGTKMHIVTPCASIRPSIASGSNVVLGVMITVAPSTRNGSSPLIPPM